jgi:Na+-transporting NADH:ubiquinone oxidoreductase subunit C
LKSGELLEKDPDSFNQGLALKDPEQSTVLEASQDPAGIKRRTNVVEIYLVKDEQKKVQEVVLPIYGNGLWSMMYAFVALDTDGRTVKGITYYDQGETPGLGGEVENPPGVNSSSAKGARRQRHAGAESGERRCASGGYHAVDGLSGATLTANGVQHSFDFWMGELGFGPFLKES